jgi:transposase InsO family protein
LIISELRGAGLMRPEQFSASSIARLLKSHGLSGPKLELETQARYRFVAATCNDLWQGDACHGPKLFDSESGRELRVKIFGLLDDKSRLVTYLRAGFHERQEDFLRVLLDAIVRRGIPRAVFLDNHGSFSGTETRVACAQLGIRLVFARPYDGASKGKIERFWRTLRSHVLDRLDMTKVKTLDDLNVRLMTWITSEYNQRPHAGISGRTPLSVFEEDADQVRFVESPSDLESSFETSLERTVRNDSTCTFRGKIYEVPTHLRRQKITLHYKLLRPDSVWIEDGGTQVPLREVDPIANARRSRETSTTNTESPKPRTSLNAIEGLLARTFRPSNGNSEGEGSSCAQS